MIEVMGYEDNFFEVTAKIPKAVIIYGARAVMFHYL